MKKHNIYKHKIWLLIIFSVIFIQSHLAYSQFSDEIPITSYIGNIHELHSADLDQDGDKEMIVTAEYGVFVYENLGNRKFKDKCEAIILNDSIRQIYTADFDGDGAIDILTYYGANSGNARFKLYWIKNLGNNLWSDQMFISERYNRLGAIVDFDNDGDIDIVSVSDGLINDTVFLHRNNGLGNFNRTRIKISSETIRAISIADLDNDNDKDLILSLKRQSTTYPNQIAWFKNSGNNINFGSKRLIANNTESCLYLFSKDLDNDGDKDVLYSSQFGGTILAWNENLGNSNFSNSISINTTNFPSNGLIIPTDIDNDGDIDIAGCFGNTLWPNHLIDEFTWISNLGNGVFGSPNIIPLNFNSWPYFGISDVDNDGDMDFFNFVYQSTNKRFPINSLVLHEMDNNVNLDTSLTIGKYILSLSSTKVSDINNDNINDLVFYGKIQDSSISIGPCLYWVQGLGGNQYSAPILIDTLNHLSSGIKEISLADLDNDGDIDIVSAYDFSWYINTSNGGSFTRNTNSGPNWNTYKDLFTIDFDNDGDIDIITRNTQNKIEIRINSGSANYLIPNKIFDISVDDILFGDIDSDGDYDLIASHTNNLNSANRIVYYSNNGLGNLNSQHTLLSNLAEKSTSIFIDDHDNDGDEDIIFSTDNTIGIINNSGNSFPISPSLIFNQLSYSFSNVMSKDLDGDGQKDLIFQSSGVLHWSKNIGLNQYDSITDLSNRRRYEEKNICITDFDNDGDLDLIFTLGLLYKISWRENLTGGPYRLSGTIFHDQNQNKIKDSNEDGLSFVKTKVTPQNTYTISNNGAYNTTTHSGTYNVSYLPLKGWKLTTDSSSYTKTISTLFPIFDSLDFGFYPDTIFTEFDLDLSSGFPRCNRIVDYWINLKNIGTTRPLGLLVSLKLDSSLSPISAFPAPLQIQNNEIKWFYNNFEYYKNEKVKIRVQMPSFLRAGDTLVSTLEARTQQVGPNGPVHHFTDTLNQVLRCAYDPNDKNVSPIGIGSNRYISKDQELEYQIRFQNTGNDTAFTVILQDQIDHSLDLSTFQLIGSSHKVQVKIDHQRRVTFTHPNIELPDSNVNQLGSIGYVKFKIKTKNALLPNTLIQNKADIYFDFNPPIRTNTVYNIIECYNTPKPQISLNSSHLISGVSNTFKHQWYLNGIKIPNATSDTLSPITSGIYSVEVRDITDCAKMSDNYIHFLINNEEKEIIDFSIFPNPFKEYTTIFFRRELGKSDNFVLINSYGQVVKTIQKLRGKVIQLHKKDIGKGIFFPYLINNDTGKKMFLGKIISY